MQKEVQLKNGVTADRKHCKKLRVSCVEKALKNVGALLIKVLLETGLLKTGQRLRETGTSLLAYIQS